MAGYAQVMEIYLSLCIVHVVGIYRKETRTEPSTLSSSSLTLSHTSDLKKKTITMQVLRVVQVVCVFLMAVAVSDAFRMPFSNNNQGYNNQGYSNQFSMNQQYNRRYQQPTQPNYMSYLPFMFDGGDQGRRLAQFQMMRSPQASRLFPFFSGMMGDMGENFPMMAMASRGGAFNPFLMMSLRDI